MSPDDLGILPRVAALLVIVAPLAVIMVTPTADPLCFLNPNKFVLVLAVLQLFPEGFFDSSPLLRPASEGERLMFPDLGEILPFSETLASSVFPRKKEKKEKENNFK